MELRFPISLHKEASCVLQLTNRTDDTIAFSTKASRDKYYAQPEEGILPPCSRRYIVVTMRAPEIAPATATQCNDVFLVQSRRVSVSKDDDLVVTPDDIAERLRKLPIGEVVVEEARLPIVYVPLRASPLVSPSRPPSDDFPIRTA
ncbi:hypothetical protein QYE76_019669 [Lolium multiflorum]|uniref:MSP domain-containing protein n=1 Tax=Lolium multiflorum TaxID=4521 RepID=A0AAD8R4G9_LOLMU|nr:hypothetical protein QYE76_019669 [Lolium multiflorum]